VDPGTIESISGWLSSLAIPWKDPSWKAETGTLIVRRSSGGKKGKNQTKTDPKHKTSERSKSCLLRLKIRRSPFYSTLRASLFTNFSEAMRSCLTNRRQQSSLYSLK